jgi:hypothetical protein
MGYSSFTVMQPAPTTTSINSVYLIIFTTYQNYLLVDYLACVSMECT